MPESFAKDGESHFTSGEWQCYMVGLTDRVTR